MGEVGEVGEAGEAGEAGEVGLVYRALRGYHKAQMQSFCKLRIPRYMTLAPCCCACFQR